QRLAESQPDVAMLLALEAHRRQPTVQTKSALLGSLLQDPGFVRYESNSTAPRRYFGPTDGAPGFSPDSKLMAVADPNGVAVRIVEARSGRKIRELELPKRTATPDSYWVSDKLIVLVAGDELMAVDPTEGTLRVIPNKLAGPATSAAV